MCDNRGDASQTWNVDKYFGDGAAVRSGSFFFLTDDYIAGLTPVQPRGRLH